MPSVSLIDRIAHLFIIASLFLFVPHVAAQDAATEDQATVQDANLTVGVQGGRFGVGTASSWPAYGLSGTYHVNEKVTAQAVLGFFGTVSSFSARGWYRFNRNEEYDLYGYATAGMYRYDYSTILANDTESVLGLGAGVGIETSLGKLFDQEDFPPIFANTELGLTYASFDFYNFSALTFGFGIHYRFGNQ
jgi:hypothetical protein